MSLLCILLFVPPLVSLYLVVRVDTILFRRVCQIKMETNRIFWIEFIEMYRDHACLWNVKSNEYSNKHKRHSSYEILLKKTKRNMARSKYDNVKM